jgi:hypothetical protein
MYEFHSERYQVHQTVKAGSWNISHGLIWRKLRRIASKSAVAYYLKNYLRLTFLSQKQIKLVGEHNAPSCKTACQPGACGRIGRVEGVLGQFNVPAGSLWAYPLAIVNRTMRGKVFWRISRRGA